MIEDKTLANLQIQRVCGCGDTGWGRVEHRSCSQLNSLN